MDAKQLVEKFLNKTIVEGVPRNEPNGAQVFFHTIPVDGNKDLKIFIVGRVGSNGLYQIFVNQSFLREEPFVVNGTPYQPIPQKTLLRRYKHNELCKILQIEEADLPKATFDVTEEDTIGEYEGSLELPKDENTETVFESSTPTPVVTNNQNKLNVKDIYARFKGRLWGKTK